MKKTQTNVYILCYILRFTYVHTLEKDIKTLQKDIKTFNDEKFQKDIHPFKEYFRIIILLI